MTKIVLTCGCLRMCNFKSPASTAHILTTWLQSYSHWKIQVLWLHRLADAGNRYLPHAFIRSLHVWIFCSRWQQRPSCFFRDEVLRFELVCRIPRLDTLPHINASMHQHSVEPLSRPALKTLLQFCYAWTGSIELQMLYSLPQTSTLLDLMSIICEICERCLQSWRQKIWSSEFIRLQEFA